jgi:hypothetical protein
MEPTAKWDESLTVMLEIPAQQIGEAGASSNTGVYHGKRIKMAEGCQPVFLPLGYTCLPTIGKGGIINDRCAVG